MTWATAETSESLSPCGDVRLVDPDGYLEEAEQAEQSGFLVVAVAPPTPAARGRLALVIENAIEEALERRGSAPPGVGASSDLDASLSDQIYRARHVGVKGVLLCMGSLQGIANLAGALDAEDSAVLRWWLAATAERPVRLMLDSHDRFLAIYDEPVSLRRLVGPPPEDVTPASGEYGIRAQPEVAASSRAMELSDSPPPVVENVLTLPCDSTQPRQPSSSEVPDADALARAMATLFDEHVESDDMPEAVEIDLASFLSAPTDEAAPSEASTAEPEQPPETTLDPEASRAAAVPDDTDDDSAKATVSEPSHSAPRPTVVTDTAETLARLQRDYPKWISELQAARGPKPLAVIERMFVSAYVPLCEAIAHGVTGDDAKSVADTWAKSFEKSYSEAFDALRMRGKRPTMVLDVPDIALRLGRLHGARSVQLVLIDGMRFDLGMRVNERLKQRVGQRAALTERLLLWSALPTRTEAQLALLGKGPEGLKAPFDDAQSEVPVARGRAAATLRRIRAGQREVLKLDLVESAMSVPGGPLPERLDALADETAQALGDHLCKQAPRTLVVMFSDHGAVIEPMGAGTAAGQHGGASPEEVLVPAFAWLVGAVH